MNQLRDKLVRIHLVNGSDKWGILKEISQFTREIQLKTAYEGLLFIPNTSILYAVEEIGEKKGLSEEQKRNYAKLEGND